MKVTILKGYNNYYNRIIKKFDTLIEYKNAVGTGNWITFDKINFIQGDGITTEQVINYSASDSQIIPDYFIVTDDDGVILNRWFVITTKKLRGCQVIYSLKRDSIADNYEAVLNADCYINKATITDVDNPLLYNQEDLAVNQIKTNETLLKDKTGSYYYLVYLPKENNFVVGNTTVEESGVTYTRGNTGTPADLSIEVTDPESVTINVDSNYPGFDIIKGMSSESLVSNSCHWARKIYFISTVWADATISSAGYRATFYYDTILHKIFLEDCTLVSTVGPAWTGYKYSFLHTLGSYEEEAIQNMLNLLNANINDVANKLMNQINANDVFGKDYKYINYVTYKAIENIQYKNVHADNWEYQGETPVDKYWQYSGFNTKKESATREVWLTNNSQFENVVYTYAKQAYESTFAQHAYSITVTRANNSSCIRTKIKEPEKYWMDRYNVTDDVSYTFSIPLTRPHTIDTTYDVIVIPANITTEESGTKINYSENLQKRLVDAISTKGMSEGWLYDVQKVPYSELSKLVEEDGILDLDNDSIKTRILVNEESGANANKLFAYIAASKNTNIELSDIIEIERPYTNQTEEEQLELENYPAIAGIPADGYASFKINEPDLLQAESLISVIPPLSPYFMMESYNIDLATGKGIIVMHNISAVERNYSINGGVINYVKIIGKTYDNPEYVDIKIDNQCNMRRLCSPGMQGIFEFNVAKNGGTTTFAAECTFRPVNPYIHVAPNFNFLYGYDANDYRGLICNDRFSIDVIKDKWLEYAAQNKYLGQKFDREITSMHVSQGIQRQEALIGAISGSIQGGVQGAKAGMAAGPWGAVAGAVIGTGIGTVGGAMDYNNLKTQQAENISFKKDMFNYSLQNIQAQPDSLVNTASDDINNKIWPYIEYYTCTDKEKEAFKSKLQFEGMTVNIIDKIANYIDEEKRFVRAQLIRSEDVADDAQIVSDIASELARGVYL